MKLILESEQLSDYIQENPPIITFNHPIIRQTIEKIKSQTENPVERAQIAFEIARDEIRHSFDSGNPKVTINADEVLENKEGICFAKAHLLASLLRGMDIPCDFCYQRVLRKNTLESGYALHGLNALFLQDIGWFRVDPRGNKTGIDSQFCYKEEKLAYAIRTELGEVDYPYVFVKPLDSVISAMKNSENTQDLFTKRPEAIDLI
ncbi:MAG: transglutaminase family protein [Bacteroidetes bacterium]|nr:transglutaminase family protein [Bacteroidota bacterium]